MEMSSETLVQSRLSITRDGRISLDSPEDGHDMTEITKCNKHACVYQRHRNYQCYIHSHVWSGLNTLAILPNNIHNTILYMYRYHAENVWEVLVC